VVQLWVKYGLEDFQTIRPQVVGDLVDRLLEGVPQDVRPAFEVAAVLRYFNVETLGVLLVGDDAEHLYAELRRWPFIRIRKEGLAVHDTMREMINEALHVRTPERFRTLHERAASYFEVRLEKATGEERERYLAERLYHRVRADEVSGMQLFQELAEELTRYHMAARLRALLNDVNTYPMEQQNSRLWREYYNARLAQLGGEYLAAEAGYQRIGENERVEPKLRAYALCDWGVLLCKRKRLSEPGGEEKAIHILEASLNAGVATDLKLAMSWVYLSDIYTAKSHWEQALFYLDLPRRFFTESSDYSGLLAVLEYELGIYERQGNLRKVFDIEKEKWKIYTVAGEPLYLRTRIAPTRGWWAGFYAQHEKEVRIALEVARSLQDQEYLCWQTRYLALCLGLQGKCSEALAAAEEGLSLIRSLGSIAELGAIAALGTYGIVCFKCGNLERAEDYLSQDITARQKIQAHLDVAPLYLATVYEVQNSVEKAEDFYNSAYKEAHPLGRHYFECGARTGVVRVKYTQKGYAAIPPLSSEAEQLAEQYEYNDYFTSLYLTRAHITWEGLIPEWESGFDSALYYYQLALIHALRFNRLLLDEALSGEEQSTPLRPIVQHCLERGKEGQRMLIALRDWWQSGVNDLGTPRPDTISPIPEGLPLLEAERIARQREPGDGSPQKSVVEQINTVLANCG
jgi:hypothetical protein